MTATDQITDRNEIRQKVAAIVIEALHAEKASNSLTDDTFLANLGLDSLNVVDILMGLERDLGLSLDDQELDFDAFETLGTLTEFVVRAKGG